MKLLLATTSPGKIRELRTALEDARVEIVTLNDLPDLAAPEEPGPGFLDNAAVKALYYHRATGLPALGEDSGIAIDALDGEPGIHSARWMGHDTSYRVKNGRILELLAKKEEAERTARYVSAVALAENDVIAFSAETTCEGRIALEPRGRGGFGYDPIFFYPPLGKTMAELDAGTKTGISHRGKSMAAFVEYLTGR